MDPVLLRDFLEQEKESFIECLNPKTHEVWYAVLSLSTNIPGIYSTFRLMLLQT